MTGRSRIGTRPGWGGPPITYLVAAQAIAPATAGAAEPAAAVIIGEPGCLHYRGVKRPRPGRVTVLCARAKEVFAHWTSPLDDDEVPPTLCSQECPAFRPRP